MGTLAAGMLFVIGPVEETSKFRRCVWGRVPLALLRRAVRRLGVRRGGQPGVRIPGKHAVYRAVWPGSDDWPRLDKHPSPYYIRQLLGLWSRGAGAGRTAGWWLAAGLAVAAIIHGLFNILVLASVQSLAWPLLALFLVALGLVWTLNRFRWAQRVSPFWLRRNYPQVECPRCRRRIFITSRFCQFCREPVAVSRAPDPICSNCRNVGRPDAAYCPRCGDRLLRR